VSTVEANDPYAGADLDNARRMTALVWALSALLAVAFLPLSPPSDPSPGVAWAGVTALIVSGVVIAWLVYDERRPLGFRGLLAINYAGIALVALGVALTGGADSVYRGLFLLAVVAGVAVHPPRRAVPLLVALTVAAALPLAFESHPGDTARFIARDLLVWLSLAAIAMALMHSVRAQRVEARERERRESLLARVDPLTGLGNRRAFEEALAAEGARSRRAGSTLSLLALDIDEFKQVNDSFGHEAGDSVLRAIAETLRKESRVSDRAFRWGGDEFVVLLPDTSAEQARGACDRFTRAIEANASAPDGTPLHVSCGTSLLSGEGEERLLAEADAALYGHKQDRVGPTVDW
jgi:diguanylate cyclase (GGDEF)-like protein